MKYDPINDIISFFVGEESDEYFECRNGALERDDFIYALIRNCQVLKIDTTNNSHGFVVTIQPGYGDAVLGVMLSWELMVASIGHQRRIPGVL